MKTLRLVAILLAALLLSVGAGPVMAQEPEDGAESSSQADISVEAAVASKISYQGRLTEGGAPVTGNRDMLFRLYSDDDCTTGVGSDINKPNVAIQDGLFSVELAVGAQYFSGRGLWLRISVEGTAIGCQELLPVPYALSLRPEAIISGTGDELLVIDNTSTSAGDVDTLILRNDSGTGEALEISAVNNGVVSFATNGYGVVGQTESLNTAGVLARGTNAGPDLIVAGNADTTSGDDGRITSDPSYLHSDLFLIANDAVQVELDNDGDGEDADFTIVDKDNAVVFDVDESGAVIYGKAGVVAFPRAAWDSGWRTVAAGDCDEIAHNLGGTLDDYVVDLQLKETSVGSTYGIHNFGMGGDDRTGSDRGGYYRDLTTSHIDLCRLSGDTYVDQMRARIWMTP